MLVSVLYPLTTPRGLVVYEPHSDCAFCSLLRGLKCVEETRRLVVLLRPGGARVQQRGVVGSRKGIHKPP